MSRRLKHFIAGAAGVLAFEGLLFARHPEAVTHHWQAFGPAGMAVAGSALVLLAAIAGLVTLCARPHHLAGAFLVGVLPPALLCAAGLPRYGAPAGDPAQAATAAAAPRPADAVWLAVSPVRHVADAATAGVRARESRVVARAVARAEQQAAARTRATVDHAVQAVISDLRTSHASELAALRAEQQQVRQEAVAAVRTEHAAQIESLQQLLERERVTARTAVEARQAAETRQARLRERMAALEAGRGGSAAQRAELAKLRQDVAVAAERRSEIVQQREDYRRLVEWYFTDVPADGPRPLRVLSKRLASPDAADRVVAARLMVLCGPAARPILRKALADHDDGVRAAVETTLVALDR